MIVVVLSSRDLNYRYRSSAVWRHPQFLPSWIPCAHAHTCWSLETCHPVHHICAHMHMLKSQMHMSHVTCTCTCACTCHMCTCACACTCACMRMHMSMCVHMCAYVCICEMCMCTCHVSYVHAVTHMDMHTCVQLHLFYTFINSRIKIQTHPILHSDPDLWGGRSLRTYAPLSVGLVRPRTVTRWSESHSHGLGQLLTNVQVREEVASRCGALGVGVTYTLLSRKRSKPLPHPTGPLWLTNLTARGSDDGAAPARGACAAAPARRRRPRRTGRAST